jgi:hypothetical protein
MCSHSNPPGRETCEKCGARLVPLVASSPSLDQDLSEPTVGDTSPPASESGSEAVSQTPPSAPAEGDWLRQMRESALAETQGQVQGFESETDPQELETGRPDWLRRLEPPDEPSPEADAPAPASPEEEESLGWLDRIEPKTEPAGPVEQDLGVPVPAAEGDIPDWLAELTSFDTDINDEESSPEQGAQGTDWFEELESESVDLESADTPRHAETPPWLESESQDEAASEMPAPPNEQEIPDWLAELTATEQAEALPEEAEAPEEEPGIIKPATPPDELEPVAVQEEDVPDWLAELTATEQAEALPEEAKAPEEEPGKIEPATPPDELEPVAVQEEEVPDWLKEMEAARAELGTQDSGSVETPVDEEETPAWLKELEPADIESEEELPDLAQTEASAEDVDLPDWMAELAPDEEEGAPPADWLTALESVEEAAGTEAKARSSIEPAVPTSEEELPEWLAEMAPAQETETAFPTESEWREEEPSADELGDLEPAELPEWLAESAPSEAQPAEEESQARGLEPPAEGIEVPDWLEEAFATQEGPQEGELEKEDLAQAEIPAWLEALRPDVEPRAPAQEVEGTLETSGLLAGIPGVVPPAAEIATPSAAPPKLGMMGAEAALARARLWQELIARTTQPAPTPLPRTKASGAGERVLRWLIYAILLAAILTPMFADVDLSGIFATDKPLAPESVATFNLVEQNVTQDSQVLIAFDYDPSFLGELQLQAGILLQQLARKGARIVALSLTPEGAGLAQQLTEDILPGYGYEPGPDYVNLGYLPGEAIGIRSLVLLGGQLSDHTFDGQDLEGTLIRASGEPLRLADMALIVLFTGNPNDLRWWVEQVTAVRRDLGQYPPLVTGVSAAIGPLARPYYLMNPRQIDGLIIGLNGAADYELLLNIPDGPAHARLGGKLLGQLVVAALLLVGIVVYGLSRGGNGSERPGR